MLARASKQDAKKLLSPGLYGKLPVHRGRRANHNQAVQKICKALPTAVSKANTERIPISTSNVKLNPNDGTYIRKGTSTTHGEEPTTSLLVVVIPAPGHKEHPGLALLPQLEGHKVGVSPTKNGASKDPIGICKDYQGLWRGGALCGFA